MQTDFEEGVCKPLPEGKRYHVFISYRDIDQNREWVRQFITQLTYSYNIICCDHVRDFQPGRKIVDNIKNAISSSVKTLIILTKGYTESFWCEYEIEYALRMNMDMNERLLIPVLKEDCDIPDYLKPFTYIDARGNMDSWLPQLVSVIESDGEQYQDRKGNQNIVHPGHSNLEILHEECSQFNCTGQVFRTSYIPQILLAEPINLPADFYSDIMKGIAGTQIVRGRHCRSCWWPTIIVWIYVLFSAIFWGINVGVFKFLSNYFLVIPIGLSLAFCGICISCCIASSKGKEQICKILRDANRNMMSHKIMFTYSRKLLQAEVRVFVFYYNMKPCVDHIETSLKKKSELDRDPDLGLYQSSANDSLLPVNLDIENQPTITHGPQTDHEGDISNEEKAQNLLLDLSIPYLQDFISCKLVYSSNKRHSTRAVCLCQYAEMKGFIKQTIDV